MSMDLEVKTFRHEPEYFEAGPHPIAKAVKTAGDDLAARSPVVLGSDGKISPITVTTTGEGDTAKTTVTTTGLYGLVPEAAVEGEDAVVYLTGEFFADSLTLPEGATVADIEVELRKIGIFLK